MRYGPTVELSAFATPFFLVGIYLFWDERQKSGLRSRAGAALIAVSCLIRFQFGILPVVLLADLARRRRWRDALTLAGAGVGALVFDFALNWALYGHPVFPIINYLRINTVGGVASGYGMTPFYFAFEILWRFMTEPAFIFAVLALPVAWKRDKGFTAAAVLLFAAHAAIAHKEFRFFYGPAVLLAGLGAAAVQSRVNTKLAIGAAALFLAVAAYRADRKVAWAQYEIPPRLETLAGDQRDVNGLITYGWGGILQGGQYAFFRPLPYVFAEDLEKLRGQELRALDYNYVVAPASEPAPCAELIRDEGGGKLYRCEKREVLRLLAPPG
jgi:hypothetical protein